MRKPQLPHPDQHFASDDRPKVLLECSDPAVAWASETILQRAGYSVVQCWGPAEHHAEDCPLLAHGECELVADADCIVQSFGLLDRRRFPTLAAIRKTHPRTPVCVEVAAASRHKYETDVGSCLVIEQPMTPRRLVQAVDRAIRHRRLPVNGANAPVI